jgi:hypothetical protein
MTYNLKQMGNCQKTMDSSNFVLIVYNCTMFGQVWKIATCMHEIVVSPCMHVAS